MQGLLDQKTPESRAINEQVSLMNTAIFHGHRGYETAFRIRGDGRDLSFRATDTQFFTILTKVPGIQPRVKMKSVPDLSQRRVDFGRICPRELVELTGQQVDRVIVQAAYFAFLKHLEPVVGEIHQTGVVAHAAEPMDVSVT